MIGTLEASPITIPSIDIDTISIKGNSCIRFAFKGHFNNEVCVAASTSWSKKFDENLDGSYDLVWDCTQMDGFDYDARNEWVSTLSKYSERINSIHVISDSLLIRGAARLIGKISKYDMQVYKTIDELNANL